MMPRKWKIVGKLCFDFDKLELKAPYFQYFALFVLNFESN